MNVLFRKFVCTLITASFAWTQTSFVAFAAEETGSVISNSRKNLQLYGKDASSFGKNMSYKFGNQQPTYDGSNLTIYTDDEEITMNQSELAPQASDNIKYSTSPESMKEHSNLWNDNAQMDSVGTMQKDQLFQNAESDSPTIEGEVYKILTDYGRAPKEDLSKDEAWNAARDVLVTNREDSAKNLVTCKQTDSTESSGETVHIPDFQVCEQGINHTQTCDIAHNYAGAVFPYSNGNGASIKACSSGETNCTEVGGSFSATGSDCQLNERTFSFIVAKPEAITRAELWYVSYKDEIQVFVGGKKVYYGPKSTFPFSDTGSRLTDIACTSGKTLIWDPNGKTAGCADENCQMVNTSMPAIDVTSAFRVAANSAVTMKVRLASGANASAAAYIRVYYDSSKVNEEEEWTNVSCIQSLNSIMDQYASGTITCTQMPQVDSNGCVDVGGSRYCPNDLGDAPFDLEKAGINKYCQKVHVEAEFDFYKSDVGCWDVPIGPNDQGEMQYEQYCPGVNEGGVMDSCQELIDKGCTFVSSECASEMTGDSGQCYMNEVVYDCGKDVQINNDIVQTVTDCEGIACSGEECIDVEHTKNQNFAKISALVQMAQGMTDDMQCLNSAPEGKTPTPENTNCTLFKGEKMKCKKVSFGIQNCCNGAKNVDAGDLITMYLGLKGITQTEFSIKGMLEQTGVTTYVDELSGQWGQTVGKVYDVLLDGVGYLSKLFESATDAVLDTVQSAGDQIAKTLLGDAYDKVKDYATDFLASTLEKAGIKTTASEVAAAGAAAPAVAPWAELTNQIAAAMSFIGHIYTAITVTKLILQMIYKCEEDEEELAAKRSSGTCHRVGSYCKKKVPLIGKCLVRQYTYCCFSSPLSRIINEQVRARQPEIIGDWGSAKAPNCAGIPISKFEEINWDAIDLREWEAIVSSTGNIAKTADDVSQYALTGAGNDALNFGSPASAGASAQTYSARAMVSTDRDRRTASDRAAEKLVGQDVDGLRIESAKCFDMYLGGGVSTGGNCREVVSNNIACKAENGMMDCSNIAHDNMLDDLLGNNRKPGYEWEQEGMHCYQDGVEVDCSTIWDKGLYDKVLDEYAAILGGTTMGEYICVDTTHENTTKICEAAMVKNGCSCASGEFVCRKANQIIDCAELGITQSKCECAANCSTADKCPYGGVNQEQVNNPYHQCTLSTCPYGWVGVGGETTCGPLKCPYGTEAGESLDKYTCFDKSGEIQQNVCEAAMIKNGCSCAPGDFVCMVDNTPVSCAELGVKITNCECLDGICVDAANCKYGGIPSDQFDNPHHACNQSMCPYGWTGDGGFNNCEPAVCPYGSSEEGAADCKKLCQYGGTPSYHGSQSCTCDGPPDCSLPENCAYGGTPKGNGTQACSCNLAPNCMTECTYGGSPVGDGTQACTCYEEPDCNESCKYGGKPMANGTRACACNAMPDCGEQCTYGGTPKGDGTQECTCNPAPDCTEECIYGGGPAANGTQACACNMAPYCGDKCTYGGVPAGGGTQDCVCNATPDCTAQCECGGTPLGNGTQECSCAICMTKVTVHPAYSKHHGSTSSGKKFYGYASIQFYYNDNYGVPVGSVSTTDLGNNIKLLGIWRSGASSNGYIITNVKLSYLKVAVNGNVCYESDSPSNTWADRLTGGYHSYLGSCSLPTSTYNVEIIALPQ